MKARPLVLAPLGLEAALLAGAGEVVRTGAGPRAVERAGRLGPSTDASGVVVAGFCGGLDASLRAGDVVVASRLIGDDGERPLGSPALLAAEVSRRGLAVRVGDVVATDGIVRGAERDRLAASGAVAVDMESARLADAASGRPFAVVRVVVDAPARDLDVSLATARAGVEACRSLRRVVPAIRAWGSAVGPRRVLLAGPRSFCAGVERAVDIVELALRRFGPPVFVRRQIVHNVHVVRDLERRGAVFVEEVDEVPAGGNVVFSAHGVSPEVRAAAARRRLRVIDATCPLVAKVHAEARRFAREGRTVVLIGHAGHEEIEGTTGEAPGAVRVVDERAGDHALGALDVRDGRRVAYLTQTTLAVDEVRETVERLRRRFPALEGPGTDDICYATQNRQDAVKDIVRECDLVLVIGSRNSSNSRRLVEVAERAGGRAELIDDEAAIRLDALTGAQTIGLTAGASAPESMVARVVDALRGLGPVDVVERRVVDESLRFTLPSVLRDAPAAAGEAS